jgi:glutamyl-tRNA reductase
MHWLMIGCSHHRTPLELREQLAFAAQEVAGALARFKTVAPDIEAVLLSTCNRVEFYAAAGEQAALPTKESVSQFLADYHGLVASEIAPQLIELRDEAAIKHLFSVAASLDSMIVGEAQILAQVKQAYETASANNHTGALTHSAFQRAAYVSKRVQNETTIHRRRISVPSVAVSEIASAFYEHFDDKRIVLVGAGEMGHETLRYLADAGARHITVVNRNLERANELAEAFKARVAPWDELEMHLGDRAICASRAIAGSGSASSRDADKCRSSGLWNVSIHGYACGCGGHAGCFVDRAMEGSRRKPCIGSGGRVESLDFGQRRVD